MKSKICPGCGNSHANEDGEFSLAFSVTAYWSSRAPFGEPLALDLNDDFDPDGHPLDQPIRLFCDCGEHLALSDEEAEALALLVHST